MIACAHSAVMANPLSAEDDGPHGRGIFQRVQHEPPCHFIRAPPRKLKGSRLVEILTSLKGDIHSGQFDERRNESPIHTDG